MSLKNFFTCLLILLLLSFSFMEVHADEQSNDIYIDVKDVDYTNYFLNADIKIHLNIKASNEFIYLILPIKYNSNMNFYVEPDSRKETILSGYLKRDGNFIAQFPPSNQNAEYFLTFTGVQIPINSTSDNEAFGYCSFSFMSINEDISNYEDNLVTIDSIHINDNNMLYSVPNAIQESNKNSLLFSCTDVPYDILIYVSKQTKKPNYFLPIMIVMFSIPTGLLAGLNSGVEKLIKKYIKYKIWFRLFSILLTIIPIYIFCSSIYPNGYYNDFTFMNVISGFFGTMLGISIAIFANTRKDSKPPSTDTL